VVVVEVVLLLLLAGRRGEVGARSSSLSERYSGSSAMVVKVDDREEDPVPGPFVPGSSPRDCFCGYLEVVLSVLPASRN
jgi:hypothetical protein